jgi:ABC-type spermidine/putrescine transport system permease subunit II
LAVLLGTLAAYAFSRFRIPLADDLLFFILSTRMMPPVAVAIPIYLMYRQLNLTDTWIGMILLYTAVNVSLAVWLLKGFIDEIPREYEEAALVDGYTRLQALRKVVLPQAVTGIAATAIFCLIFSWNEYAFAVLLTSGDAQTMPPFIPFIIGEGGQDWPAVAAATTLFVIPIVLFTILLRGICCAASPSGRCANEHRHDQHRRTWPLVSPRTVGKRGHDADRRRHRDAGAAVVDRSLRLFVRDHPRRHAWFCRREPLSGIGGSAWHKSGWKICANPSTSLPRCRIRISPSRTAASLRCSGLRAAARPPPCA